MCCRFTESGSDASLSFLSWRVCVWLHYWHILWIAFYLLDFELKWKLGWRRWKWKRCCQVRVTALANIIWNGSWDTRVRKDVVIFAKFGKFDNQEGVDEMMRINMAMTARHVDYFLDPILYRFYIFAKCLNEVSYLWNLHKWFVFHKKICKQNNGCIYKLWQQQHQRRLPSS